MSYFRRSDPDEDFLHLDREQSEQEEQLPVCDGCDKSIDEDYFFEIDTEILCEDCMKRRYRKNTNDYIRKDYL